MIEQAAGSAYRAGETFRGAPAARKYAQSLVGTKKHEREAACVRKGLAPLKPGHKVLDIPCGTGRMLPVLCDMGFRVTEADINTDMLESAQGYARYLRLPEDRIRFRAASVFETGFDQYEFDGIVCNRLFHHFTEPDTRIAAFRELRRICAGPIVASFFCSRSWDGVVFRMRERLRRHKSNDRVPISPRRIRQEADRAGLVMTRVLPSRHVLSKQWYCVFEEWYQFRKPVSAFAASGDEPRYTRPCKYEESFEE